MYIGFSSTALFLAELRHLLFKYDLSTLLGYLIVYSKSSQSDTNTKPFYVVGLSRQLVVVLYLFNSCKVLVSQVVAWNVKVGPKGLT